MKIFINASAMNKDSNQSPCLEVSFYDLVVAEAALATSHSKNGIHRGNKHAKMSIY